MTTTAARAKIDGLASARSRSYAMTRALPSANQTGGSLRSPQGTLQQSGAVDRGYIEVAARANPDGETFSLDVSTFHHDRAETYLREESTPNDDVMSLYLQARVQDGATEGVLTLGVLKEHEALNNLGAFRGLHTFTIGYDDVDAYLARLNPNLKLTPGAQLAVFARWDDGHEWGGFGRKGNFDVPRAATTSPLASSSGAAARVAELPLDIAYKVPDALQAKYPTVIEQGGEVTTRLESEMKAEASERDVEDAVVELYKLAHDPAAAERVFGTGWKVVPVRRYWRKDDHGDVVESPRFAARKASDPALAHVVIGDPDPLHDAYHGRRLLELGWAVRVRSNETKAGLLNVKPGLGRMDPKTLIRQRIEIGMTLAPGANIQDVRDFLMDDESAYNPTLVEMRRLEEAGEHLPLRHDMLPVLELTAERHRFNLEHEDGVSVELTADFTKGKEVLHPLPRWEPVPATPRVPRESYICGVEAELDHLNFGQANQGTASGGIATSTQTPLDEAEQQRFAASLSPEASLYVPPRFHTTADLDNDAFRTSESYRAFEDVLAKLKAHLFPQGLTAARQKGQAAALAMGLIAEHASRS